jgi:RHS repeat-associated protein
VQDRIGTNRATGARYYPFGDEITSTANDAVKFGTYHRDGFTGLDYADQRYYASTYGRFNGPDPYAASGGPNDPASWNRYSYTRGDPINSHDPHGLQDCNPFINPEDCCLPSEIAFGANLLGDPGCSDPDPGPDPPSPGPTPPSEPQCAVEFGTVPAFSSALLVQHTFFEVDDGSSWQVVDAGPSNNPPYKIVPRRPVKIGDIPIPLPPKVQWIGWGSLTTNVSANGLYGENTNPDRNITYYQDEPCSFVAKFEQEARNLNNVVSYSAPQPGSTWYNSNSFTYTLDVDFGLGVTPPSLALGWGNYHCCPAKL